jgi:hypothetical protein
MKRRVAVLLALIAILILAGSAIAMSSTNYRLDWFIPMTGGGGGLASSANYAVNVTVGQSVIGASSSTNYQDGLGYWYRGTGPYYLYLPLILR